MLLCLEASSGKPAACGICVAKVGGDDNDTVTTPSEPALQSRASVNL